MSVPRYVLDDLAGTVEQLADAIGGPAAAALRADASKLVDDPERLAERLGAAVAAVTPLDKLEGLADPGPALDAVREITSHRRTQARTQAALVSFVRESAAIEAAARLGTTQFADRAALLAGRDRGLELLGIAEAAPALHTVIAELRAALVEHLAERAPALARIVTTGELAGLPALVASYRLYGDIASDGDIAARNALARPGFVPAGDIEVAIRD